MKQKIYYIYILSNKSRTVLYIGVTNNIERRFSEHKHPNSSGFTAKYKTHDLIYLEEYVDINLAIAREKQLKKWSRSKKIALISMQNPDMKTYKQ